MVRFQELPFIANPPTIGSMRTVLALSFIFALSALLLVACNQPTPTPTPTPAPTATPTPTPTATPTPTPILALVSVPQDDAPHEGVTTEWWYYNGILRTTEGRQYSFHYVVFQFDLPFLPTTTVSHLAITDHREGTYITGQRRTLARTRPAESPGFSFNVDGWVMSGFDGRDRLTASTGGYAFDLNLNAEKPPALHGGTGLIDFGPLGESYYYSRTRMAASGTLSVQGEEAAVTGEAWFDHQWGDFNLVRLGWDWFSLRLDDRSELMLYLLRGEEGQPTQITGTFVTADGRTTSLDASEFSVRPTGTWTSPTNGGVYPMGWILLIPSIGIDVILTPVIPNAEFDARSTTRNFYWEGGVSVSGSHGGWGMVELVGYAPDDLPF